MTTSTLDDTTVSDPTDWLPTSLSALTPLEASLRCHVCKDFYDSPMITSCSHTFCSLCIRRALNADGKCPLCRNTNQESQLRGNWALREVVDAFVGSRAKVMEVARRPLSVVVIGGPSETDEERRGTTPKRKVEESGMDEGLDGHDEKRPRRTTRASSARAAASNAIVVAAEADEPEEQDDDFTPEDGLVTCPICSAKVKMSVVNTHLDKGCPPSPAPALHLNSVTTPSGLPSITTTRQSFANNLERIPSLSYSLLKDNQLRKKMSELGLSPVGSRQLLEKRHMEWTTLWNANCDSADPKTKSQLHRELDAWERTLGSRASTTSHSAVLATQIRDKAFDGAAWNTRHADDFKDLIANARASRSKALPPAPETRSEGGAELPQRPSNMSAGDRYPGADGSASIEAPSESVSVGMRPLDLTIPSSSQPAHDAPVKYSEPPDSSQPVAAWS